MRHRTWDYCDKAKKNVRGTSLLRLTAMYLALTHPSLGLFAISAGLVDNVERQYISLSQGLLDTTRQSRIYTQIGEIWSPLWGLYPFFCFGLRTWQGNTSEDAGSMAGWRRCCQSGNRFYLKGAHDRNVNVSFRFFSDFCIQSRVLSNLALWVRWPMVRRNLRREIVFRTTPKIVTERTKIPQVDLGPFFLLSIQRRHEANTVVIVFICQRG